jgi:ribonuclease G
MAKNLLVINVDIRETRVALIENGVIAELHLERHSSRGTLGNIYLGKVSRVLPGMQAAFIDIGQERAAFLHVEDLIRPDDFEAYLSGHRGRARDDEHGGSGEAGAGEAEHTHGAPALVAATAGVTAAAPAHEENGEDLDDEGPSVDDLHAEASEHEGASEGEHDDAVEARESDAGADDEASADDDANDVDEASAGDDDDDDDDDDHEAGVLAGAGDDDDDAPVEDASRVTADESDEDADERDASASDAVQASAPVDTEDFDLPSTDAGEAEGEAAGADEAAAATGEEAAGDAGTTAKRARSRRGGRGRRRRGSTADRADLVAAAAAANAVPAPRADRQGGERQGGERQGGERGRNQDRQGGRGQERGRGRGRGRGDKNAPAGDRQSSDRQSSDRQGSDRGGRAQGARDRDRGRGKDPLRVSRSTPIREVVREGQEVIVQVSKEPIGTKGARVTSHISLPGRYVVYLPTVEHIGISKRIGSEKERGRLREAIEAMKPPQGGLIVRTLAEGLTKKSLKADVGYLVRLWGEIAKKRETTERPPQSLYVELDLVLKTARDLFTDDVEKIVIDSKEEYVRLKRFIEMFMPERANAIELYEGNEPIFDEYGIEDEIGRALSRKVPLASGGHLVIDQAEALTAIDVNTGRFVGKGSKDLEETILQTNLEAVEEIAYQLRFRNIGGLIILDLIDMERASNREKVRRKLEQLLAKDKAKTTLNRISELGLIEMTRKRTRESLGRQMNEPCFYCDGTGNLQSKQTVAYEILRQIKRDRANLRGYSVVVNAHPAIVDLMKNEERGAVQEAERRYTRRIELVPRKEYHLEQFDLVGK